MKELEEASVPSALQIWRGKVLVESLEQLLICYSFTVEFVAAMLVRTENLGFSE